MSRIFISYRASDGKKDASRLAGDLVRHFGEAQVFFDKTDLTAGSSWREQVRSEIGQKPVVVLLLTPDYFGAVREGERRIDRDDDPVRLEILAAMEAGATLLPLLTEGVSLPSRSELPAALAGLRENHALKLRTDDWPHDLSRLLRDLERLGLAPEAPAPAPAGQTKPWLALLIMAAVTWLLLEAAGTFGEDLDSDSHIGVAVLMLLPLALAWITWRWTRHDKARVPRWSSLAVVLLAGWSLLVQLGQAGVKHNAEQQAIGQSTGSPVRTP